MTRDDFTKIVSQLVGQYIFEGTEPQSNAQLRVNPQSLAVSIVSDSDYLAEIADNNEAVEDAAAADGLASEDATDWQSSQNPDFYPIPTLLTKTSTGQYKPNPTAIAQLATHYPLK